MLSKQQLIEDGIFKYLIKQSKDHYYLTNMFRLLSINKIRVCHDNNCNISDTTIKYSIAKRILADIKYTDCSNITYKTLFALASLVSTDGFSDSYPVVLESDDTFYLLFRPCRRGCLIINLCNENDDYIFLPNSISGGYYPILKKGIENFKCNYDVYRIKKDCFDFKRYNGEFKYLFEFLDVLLEYVIRKPYERIRSSFELTSNQSKLLDMIETCRNLEYSYDIKYCKFMAIKCTEKIPECSQQIEITDNVNEESMNLALNTI